MDKNIIDMPMAYVYGPDPNITDMPIVNVDDLDSLDIDEIHGCVYGPPEWYQEDNSMSFWDNLPNDSLSKAVEKDSTNIDVDEQIDMQTGGTKNTSIK